MCGGVDTLLLGFEHFILLGIAWAWSSLSSLKVCFVLCGCSPWHRTLIVAGPYPILSLFSQNLSPPLVQPLVSSETFTVSPKLMPIYPLPFHASTPFHCSVCNLHTPEFHYSWSIFRIPFSQTSCLIDSYRYSKLYLAVY